MINDADYSAACDDLADLGLTEDQIDDVWRWHYITARRQAQTAGGVAIVRILSWLLDATARSNMRLRIVGMAFGTGLGHLTGYEDMSQAAAALGVSHQAVEYAAKQASKAMLG